jgi:hypothetical protein
MVPEHGVLLTLELELRRDATPPAPWSLSAVWAWAELLISVPNKRWTHGAKTMSPVWQYLSRRLKRQRSRHSSKRGNVRPPGFG